MKKGTTNAHAAANFAIVVAITLAISKFILFYFSGFMIVALSAWDSTADSVVSSINRYVIKFARQDADEDHPYGHGKAEAIAAFAQGLIITAAAGTILYSSFVKLLRPEEGHTEFSYYLVWFFLAASALSGLLTFMLSQSAKKFESIALKGDAEHYRTDMLTNFASAIAIWAVYKSGLLWLDPVIASSFSLYVGFSGVKLAYTSAQELMDHDVPSELKQKVVKVIYSSSSHVVDVHRLRGRKSGHRVLLDCHVTLNASLSFKEAHAVIDIIEDRIKEDFNADIVIHADPA